MAKQSAHVQKIFSKAVTSLQQGNITDARKGFMKLSRQLPDSAVIWYNLGLCQQHMLAHSKAVESYKKSLKINPGQVDGWTNLGISYKELHQPEKAEQAIRKALALDPAHPRALNLLGSIQAEEGDIHDARDSLKESISRDPRNKDARINLANLEFNAENLEEAERLTHALATDYPDEVKVKLLRGRLLVNHKDYKAASPIVTDLETSLPDDDEVMRLGLSFREAMRDHFGAITVCEKLLKKFPDEATVWNSLASAYFQLDGIEKSREYYQKAVSLEPDNAGYRSNLGLAYSSMGDKGSAEKSYRKSIQLDPKYAETYRHIAAMKKFKSVDDPDAQQVISLWENDDINDFTRIKTAFALGKIYDDCGEHEMAFDVYRVGNELKFRDTRLDLDIYYKHIDRIPEVFDSPPFKTSQRSNEICPIFILGMPRSGTTLVEQIITRHSRVQGCGELPCIERAISRLEKKADPMRVYPDDFWEVERSELEREAGEYLDWIARLHDIRTPYLTDKMPFNYTHVWLIKALFPDSPIVSCQRHPLDVIISNYFQLYGSDVSFVYDLDALAQYYIRYHRLMIHWGEVFDNQIYNAMYEALVADIEGQSRQLINAVNLEWEDNCLDPNQSHTVRTASIWQVREGIYTSSLERWRKYEKYLGGVISTLAAEGILDQDGNWIAHA